MVLDMRTDDGSEPMELNYDLGRYERRNDSLRLAPGNPLYGVTPVPAFAGFDRSLNSGQGRIRPWTMNSSKHAVPRSRVPRSSEPGTRRVVRHDPLRRGADSNMRTDDESEIALVWEDGPWGITATGHRVYIGMQILQDRGLDFIDLARAFALIGMTQ